MVNYSSGTTNMDVMMAKENTMQESSYINGTVSTEDQQNGNGIEDYQIN